MANFRERENRDGLKTEDFQVFEEQINRILNTISCLAKYLEGIGAFFAKSFLKFQK